MYPDYLEQQVYTIAMQTNQSIADVRRNLMAQNNLTMEQYAALNPQSIRCVGYGGMGFIGQPG